MAERLQKKTLLSDLKKKMVFLVGPRQVGKTFLSKTNHERVSKPSLSQLR